MIVSGVDCEVKTVLKSYAITNLIHIKISRIGLGVGCWVFDYLNSHGVLALNLGLNDFGDNEQV